MIEKKLNLFKDIHFIINTNEKVLPLVNLSLKYFDTFIGLDNINISIVSNKFKDCVFNYSDKVNYITPDVEYDGSGGHFEAVISNALNNIKEEYIFFFCDDYIITKQFDIEALLRLMQFIINEKVDYFSFSSCFVEREMQSNPLAKYRLCDNSEKYGFDKDAFYHFSENFLYLYSVQPCIWKRSSLLELLSYNKNVGIRTLDTSYIKDKKGKYRDQIPNTGIYCYDKWAVPDDEYQFKKICTKYNIFDYSYNPDFFIFNYIEIVRYGKIWQTLGENNWVQIIINQIIKDNDINNKSEFNQFL